MRTSPRGFVTLLVEDDIDGTAFFKTLPQPSAAGSILGDFSPLRGSGLTRGLTPPSPSRVDLFGEYTYFHPVNSEMFNQQYPPITGGVAGGIAGYFSRSFGIQGEYTYFFNHPDYCEIGRASCWER